MMEYKIRTKNNLKNDIHVFFLFKIESNKLKLLKFLIRTLSFKRLKSLDLKKQS